MSQVAKQPSNNTRFYDFGPFRVDTVNRLLMRDIEIVPLTSKVFDLLLMFVSNAGRMLDKDEMMKQLWPDSFVEEGNLTRNVSTLRKALGETPQQHQYIVTVPGRGYRFVASVDAIPDESINFISYERTSLEVVLEKQLGLSEVDEPSRQARPALVGVIAGWAGHKRRQRLLISVIAVLGVLIAALASHLTRMAKRESASTFRQITMTSLTSTGDVYTPTISPNGKYLAYSSLEPGGIGLRIRQVSTGSIVQLVPAAPVQYWGISFSRDSEYVYYVAGGPGTDWQGALYRVPSLGGHPQRLTEGASAGPIMSPDGRRLAFALIGGTPAHGDLFVADLDGKNSHNITVDRSLDCRAAVWSPDNNSITYVIRKNDAEGPSRYVAEIPIGGASERVIVPPRKTPIVTIDWLPDHSGLILNAIDPETHAAQLSLVTYPSGEVRRITNDLNNYKEISVTADGGTIVVQKRDTLSQLWVSPNDNPSHGRLLLTAAGLAYHYLSWTPDNQLVFDAEENGVSDIWKVSADGNGRKRLTYQQGQNTVPSVTPDGRYIVFISTRSGSQQLWRMDDEGNNPKQLTSGSGSVSEPQCAPDGRWVFYTTSVGRQTKLVKIPVEGGASTDVIENPVEYWAISPDGKALAYSYRDEEAKRNRVAVVRLVGSAPIEHFDLAPVFLLRWTKDGKGLVYIASDDDNIWVKPIAGGPPKQLTHLQPDLIQLMTFAWSPDGKQLAYTKGVNAFDAVALNLK